MHDQTQGGSSRSGKEPGLRSGGLSHCLSTEACFLICKRGWFPPRPGASAAQNEASETATLGAINACVIITYISGKECYLP